MTRELNLTNVMSATRDELIDEIAAAGINVDDGLSMEEMRRSAVVAIVERDDPDLVDYYTAEVIRPATAEEAYDSVSAATTDGGPGVIDVGGRSCYVMVRR